jgi:integrase
MRLKVHNLFVRNKKVLFRMSVPKDLRDKIGQWELKKALIAEDLNEAYMASRSLTSKFKKLFCIIRANQLSTEDISRLIQDEFRSIYCLEKNPLLLSGEKTNGNSKHPVTAMTDQQSPYLKDLAKAFFEEKIREKSWAERTIRAENEIFDLFYQVFGTEVRISDFNHKQLLDFRNNVLLRLPPNRNKVKRYRDKTYSQILAMKDIEPISVNTANSKISKISTFFDWCHRHEYISKNCAEGLMLKAKTSPREERQPYSQEELIRLLQQLPYEDHRAYRYWIPLIALLSGMRQSEIAQLLCSDIMKKDDIHYFNINETEEGQRTKNESSRRIVPIHPTLVELGLLDYHSKVHTKDLWPELKTGRDGKGQNFQRWYGIFNRKHITQDRRRVFHSLRHNVVSSLAENGVQESVISELVGHALEGETMGRYKKSYDVRILYQGLCKLNYSFDIIQIVKTSQHQ